MGDAHLGRSYYPVSDGGINVRETDFEESFSKAVDLALSASPDVVVLLGDLFDYPRPSYRSFRVAMRLIKKILVGGTPVVGISGNHDTPRLAGTESPYGALQDAISGLNVAYAMRYEHFEIGDTLFHLVPQTLRVEDSLEALDQANRNRSLDKVNLVLTHPRLRQLEPSFSDINEITIDIDNIGGDLGLLGHYHTYQRVSPTVHYVGATDSFSYSDDPSLAKGILVMDTSTGEVRQVEIPDRRALLTPSTIHCAGLGTTEILDAVLERLHGGEPGAVMRVRLDEIDPAQFQSLDSKILQDAAADLLYYKLDAFFTGLDPSAQLPQLDGIPIMWRRFVDERGLEKVESEEIAQAGESLILQAIEES